MVCNGGTPSPPTTPSTPSAPTGGRRDDCFAHEFPFRTGAPGAPGVKTPDSEMMTDCRSFGRDGTLNQRSNCSYRSAARSQENLCSMVDLAPRLNCAQSDWFANKGVISSAISLASASGSNRKPLTPSSTSSVFPGMCEAATGRPDANASRITFDIPSYLDPC